MHILNNLNEMQKKKKKKKVKRQISTVISLTPLM